MLTRQKRKSRRFLYSFRAAILMFGVYFAYHAFHGNHGLLAYAQVQDRVVDLQADITKLQTQKISIETRVAALRDSALDGDLVDERARDLLALIGPSERILID